jgi:hypothetical protein
MEHKQQQRQPSHLNNKCVQMYSIAKEMDDGWVAAVDGWLNAKK